VNDSISIPFRRDLNEFSSSLLSSAAERFDFLTSNAPLQLLQRPQNTPNSVGKDFYLNESLGFPSFNDLDQRVNLRTANQLTNSIQQRLQLLGIKEKQTKKEEQTKVSNNRTAGSNGGLENKKRIRPKSALLPSSSTKSSIRKSKKE
jgi:hypothetical protein